MTAEEEQQLRERAYSIWEQEGRPHGRDLEHRRRAEAEIAAERSRGRLRAATEMIEAPARSSGVMVEQFPGDTGKRSQHDLRDDQREGITIARKAAEALFTARPKVPEELTPEGSAPARKPRVLPIVPAAPGRDEELEKSSSPKQTSKIARPQFARIRTLVRYGMTARQVAEVYGVALGEIERILRVA
jgi:hypothetical protein